MFIQHYLRLFSHLESPPLVATCLHHIPCNVQTVFFLVWRSITYASFPQKEMVLRTINRTKTVSSKNSEPHSARELFGEKTRNKKTFFKLCLLGNLSEFLHMFFKPLTLNILNTYFEIDKPSTVKADHDTNSPPRPRSFP